MIKINPTNRAKIEATLTAANGRATQHAYSEYYEVARVADEAEARLESLGIQKAARTGAEYFAVSGYAVPSAYNYSRKATAVCLVRRATGWFLTSASQVTIWAEAGKQELLLTQEQDARAIEVLRRRYSVQRPVVATAA